MIELNLDGIITDDRYKPNDEDQAAFFFLSNGICLSEFEQLPIPYILAMLLTNAHHNEEYKKQHESSSK